jgi:hypothetical protein
MIKKGAFCGSLTLTAITLGIGLEEIGEEVY